MDNVNMVKEIACQVRECHRHSQSRTLWVIDMEPRKTWFHSGSSPHRASDQPEEFF